MKTTEDANKIGPSKIKVAYAKIYVAGNEEKPYYGIEYHSLDDNTIHHGFGSYSIEFVKIWLIECFEFIYCAPVEEPKEVVVNNGTVL